MEFQFLVDPSPIPTKFALFLTRELTDYRILYMESGIHLPVCGYPFCLFYVKDCLNVLLFRVCGLRVYWLHLYLPLGRSNRSSLRN